MAASFFCQTFHQEAIQLFRDAFAVNPALQQVLQHVANAERAVAKQPGLLTQAGSRDDNDWYLQSYTKMDCKLHIVPIIR